MAEKEIAKLTGTENIPITRVKCMLDSRHVEQFFFAGKNLHFPIQILQQQPRVKQ